MRSVWGGRGSEWGECGVVRGRGGERGEIRKCIYLQTKGIFFTVEYPEEFVVVAGGQDALF